MTLKGYDENGNLAFRQGPFTFAHEAFEMFASEKRDAVKNGIFCLILEDENARPHNKVEGVNYASFCR